MPFPFSLREDAWQVDHLHDCIAMRRRLFPKSCYLSGQVPILFLSYACHSCIEHTALDCSFSPFCLEGRLTTSPCFWALRATLPVIHR
jgi:hypothetical protein